MHDLLVNLPQPCSEKWDDMAPKGCNRFCAQCSTTIHDFANYTFEEAEALLSSPEPVCVRAQLGNDRTVALRPSGNGKLRRIVVAASASIGMIAMSSAAIAAKTGPEGVIAGMVYSADPKTRVTAIAADGTRYEVTTDRKGRYRIKHLPLGTYELEFSSGETVWKEAAAVVKDEKITYVNTGNPDAPIIVGVMSRAGDDYT
ncbi:MAG: hypothetical protein J7496_02890 [Novosphingobium sp.]|nr:hypothetical protein [Novosphingobium sp.]MBO9601435.1 hypothetical protein [Novosphingobium sp.]